MLRAITIRAWLMILGIVVMFVLLVVVFFIGFHHGLTAPPTTEPFRPQVIRPRTVVSASSDTPRQSDRPGSSSVPPR